MGFLNLQTQVRVTAAGEDGQTSTFQQVSSKRRIYILRCWTNWLCNFLLGTGKTHCPREHQVLCYHWSKHTGAREQWNDLWGTSPPPPSMKAWRCPCAWPTFSWVFLFQVSLLELAGAVDQLTCCLARIRAWMRASWLWPSPDKPKVVLTGWGREGAGRTSALYDKSLLFPVQFSTPRVYWLLPVN